MTTLVLIAKETIPGKVKTRLHPPLSLEQAAELAAASIADTLDAIRSLPTTRRVLAFDGTNVPEGTEGWDVVQQCAGGLDERLAAVFDQCDGPTVLIGMDTPQLAAADLAPVFGEWRDGVDAWFGPATDGGFWALALRDPRGDLIRGVPMSRTDTGALQFDRLRAAGLGVGLLRPLNDVDDIHDAWEAAQAAPHSRFAATLTGFYAHTRQVSAA
ncbi:MAG: glycosyltransferase [Microbacteriaceae bacterium]|nr:glycosyltransferase [Microbacteriaceae bacterium]